MRVNCAAMSVTELFERPRIDDEPELQVTRSGSLRHLLTLRGLDRGQITGLLDRSESFLTDAGERVAA